MFWVALQEIEAMSLSPWALILLRYQVAQNHMFHFNCKCYIR